MNETDPYPKNVASDRPSVDGYDDEIDLASLIAVLWKQRWFMLAVIATALFLSIGYILIATPMYEITAQIAPGITGYNDRQEPLRDWTANDIRAWFANKSFVPALNCLGGYAENQYTHADVSTAVNGNIVMLKSYWPNAETGLRFLNQILDVFSASENGDLGKSLSVNRKKMEERILEKEQLLEKYMMERGNLEDLATRSENEWLLEKADYEKEISTSEKEIALIEQNMLMIEKQVQNIDDTIRSLKARIEAVNSNKNEIQKAKQSIYQKLQQANGDSDELVQMREKLASGNPDSADLLMYVSKVQQQTNYLNNLQQSIVSFDREIESLTDEESRLLEEIEALNVKKFELLSQKNTQLPLQAADLKSNIVVLKVKLDQGEKENIKKRKEIVTTGEKELMLKSEYTKKEIDTLKAKMKDIRAIEVLQPPFSSKNPVKPAKAKIIVLSFFLGGLLAVFLAFIREFWINNKSKIIHAK